VIKNILINLFSLSIVIVSQTKYENINNKVRIGNYSNAEIMIKEILDKDDLSQNEIDSLQFEIERHERIRKDFKLSEKDVLNYVKNYIPNADKEIVR